jgi:hypothetical protein
LAVTNDNIPTSAIPREVLNVCPECDFTFQGPRCPLCGRTLTASDGPTHSIGGGALHQNRAAGSFGLSTLFMFITLLAVCLGVGLAAPGLGILLGVLGVPAFFRASAWTAREKAAGRAPDAADRFGLFLGSLGIIFVIGLAGCIAFLAACWVSCLAVEASGTFRGGSFGITDAGIILINVVAGGLALLLFGWLLWKTWPRRRIPPKSKP